MRRAERRAELLLALVMSTAAAGLSAQDATEPVTATPSGPARVEIDPAESVFAIVTHKGGIASGAAHNHLVTAVGYQAQLSFDPSSASATSFAFTAAVEDLEVDRWDLEQRWYPRLEELGVLSEPFSEVGEKDRSKIRDSMLGKSQLHAAEHPSLSAKLASVEERTTTHGGVEFPYAVKLVLEIRGQSVAKTVSARFEESDGGVSIEAVGTFLFSEFGIKPYSALLGAVKNQDEVHVYVSLKGAR